MSPAKEWNNYYWLFQVIVFSIYTLSGYYGLILFRALLYMSTIFLIFRYLTHDGTSNQRVKNHGTALFILYALSIIPRELFLVRPHLFSYLFIAAALLIIEQRKKQYLDDAVHVSRPGQPAWDGIPHCRSDHRGLSRLNFHRKYPQTDTAFSILQKSSGMLLILSVYCLFLTPAGFSLIKLPMNMSPFLNHAIMEMLPVPFIQLPESRLQIRNDRPGQPAACIIILNAIVCVILIVNKSIRPSHLILFIGAIVLMR